jgi:hypothetical protein
MISSRVSCEREKDRTVIGLPCHGSHELSMREGKTPRLCPSHPRWNSEAAFGLTGWKLWAIIAIVIAVVVAVVAVVLVGSMKPPVDVYARPTPAADVLPEDFLPNATTGHAMTSFNSNIEDSFAYAMADYEGGIHIEITRFNSAGDAQSYVSDGDDTYSTLSGSHLSASSGEKQWFTHNGGGESSVFVWRKGVWVFEIYAPDADMVKQVAEEFPY